MKMPDLRLCLESELSSVHVANHLKSIVRACGICDGSLNAASKYDKSQLDHMR
jgi:hypothetical protein